MLDFKYKHRMQRAFVLAQNIRDGTSAPWAERIPWPGSIPGRLRFGLDQGRE